MRIAGNGVPDIEHHRRDRRPRYAGLGMGRLIAVAAVLVGHPAEGSEVGHEDREGFAGPRHSGNEEWRGCLGSAEFIDETNLRAAVEVAG